MVDLPLPISEDLLESAQLKAERRYTCSSWADTPGDFGLRLGQWCVTLQELRFRRRMMRVRRNEDATAAAGLFTVLCFCALVAAMVLR